MPVRHSKGSFLSRPRLRQKGRWITFYIRYGWLSFLLLAPTLTLLIFLLWLDRQPVYDLVIQNGRVFDGDQMLHRLNGVAIRDGVIEKVGFVYGLRARLRINAWNRIVAPGFVDTHVHVERNITPGRPLRAANFLRMGVTTVVTGNCGTSAKDIGHWLSGIEAAGTQVNLATLVGHNTIREAVMGRGRTEPTAAELEAMVQLVERAMADGALGMSTGLEYPPGVFAGENEIVLLARVAASWGGIYATHIRNESLNYAAAIEEALRTAQRAQAKLHLSHLKIACPSKWAEMPAALERIERARRAGLQVTQDVYVYTASSTSLEILLPAEYRDPSSRRSLLRNRDQQQRLIRTLAAQLRREGFSDFSHVRVAHFRELALNGKTIAEIAQILPLILPKNPWRESSLAVAEVDEELRRQLEAVLYLLAGGGAQMIYFVMDENNIEAILRDSHTMIGSDSAVRNNQQITAHPRGSGNFPRVLAKYVRERGVLGWVEALRRMTSLPVDTFGIERRGRIKKGYAADVVVFHPDQIQDRAWYDHPLDPPSGIDYVIVNGRIVVHNGDVREVFPGRVVRLNRTSRLPVLRTQSEPSMVGSMNTPSETSSEASQSRRRKGRMADVGSQAPVKKSRPQRSPPRRVSDR